MGDLNASMPTVTGDTGLEKRNKNGVMLQNLMKDLDMSACVNKAQQTEGTHWTYLNPTEKEGVRKSVPDYILYPRTSQNLCNNYKVIQEVSCNSFHRLLTVRINVAAQKLQSI